MSTYYLVEPQAVPSSTPDYSTVYNNISQELADIDNDTTPMAATLALIAASLATMAANSTVVAEKTTTIANKQTAMETYQKTLKELGEGQGIHIRGPFESLGMISVYRLLIEQARILESEGVATAELQAQAKNKVEEYITKIDAEFKEF